MQKNSILKSYSNVLCDILSKETKNAKEALGIIQSLAETRVLEQVSVNPANTKEYKHAIAEIATKLEKGSELENFLMQILIRKYGNFLNEILALTEQKIRKESDEKKIIIRSKEELSNEMKQEIQQTLKAQGITAQVQYEQNPILENGNIEFISNSKICTLNVESLLNKIFIEA